MYVEVGGAPGHTVEATAIPTDAEREALGEFDHPAFAFVRGVSPEEGADGVLDVNEARERVAAARTAVQQEVLDPATQILAVTNPVAAREKRRERGARLVAAGRLGEQVEALAQGNFPRPRNWADRTVDRVKGVGALMRRALG